ncbi:MAG: biotin--[acetyl-CoA-carboxylase] ligase, partial [Bacteroidales bacterium]|nr:biotin--[acetyl-CoA-carboxylase] ligase [Bacteroidales bacterium]
PEDIPACITAGFQTGGKGQSGNHWLSERQKNLLASFVIRPQTLTPASGFYLSKASALAVYDCLEERLDNIRIKWPNDLLAGHKKIGGILIENTLAGNQITKSIIGIGININQETFPSFAPDIEATSLRIESGRVADPEEILSEIAENLEFWIQELDHGNFEGIDREYFTKLMGFQDWKKYNADDRIFEAKIINVKENGYLVLLTRNEEKLEFAFKEVKLILA